MKRASQSLKQAKSRGDRSSRRYKMGSRFDQANKSVEPSYWRERRKRKNLMDFLPTLLMVLCRKKAEKAQEVESILEKTVAPHTMWFP